MLLRDLKGIFNAWTLTSINYCERSNEGNVVQWLTCMSQLGKASRSARSWSNHHSWDTDHLLAPELLSLAGRSPLSLSVQIESRVHSCIITSFLSLKLSSVFLCDIYHFPLPAVRAGRKAIKGISNPKSCWEGSDCSRFDKATTILSPAELTKVDSSIS